MQVEKERFSLKDHLFNATKVKDLAHSIKAAYPEFESHKFAKEVVSKFKDLELKQRISHITDCLYTYLPQDYKSAVKVILKALPPVLDENKEDGDYGDFIHAPYGEFIAKYGCTKEFLLFSLHALKEITKRFSVEFAIRPFLNNFQSETIAEILKWTQDKNYHVRRLCSEGTRPNLPWAEKVEISKISAFTILHILHADNTRYVTRSVANHLNDLTKKDPTLVLKYLKHWQKVGKQSREELDFINKQALRTLVKDGNKEALKFLGFGKNEGLSISNLRYGKKVNLDDSLIFSFDVFSKSSCAIIVDYILYAQNKLGKMAAKKVFKLKVSDINPNLLVQIQKKHSFKTGMTTRRYYKGKHRIELQVNGVVMEGFDFEVI